MNGLLQHKYINGKEKGVQSCLVWVGPLHVRIDARGRRPHVREQKSYTNTVIKVMKITAIFALRTAVDMQMLSDCIPRIAVPCVGQKLFKHHSAKILNTYNNIYILVRQSPCIPNVRIKSSPVLGHRSWYPIAKNCDVKLARLGHVIMWSMKSLICSLISNALHVLEWAFLLSKGFDLVISYHTQTLVLTSCDLGEIWWNN